MLNNNKFNANSGRGTAALRALESLKGNKGIIQDKYAHLLAGKIGFRWANSLSPIDRNFMIDMIAVRTKIFDDLCESPNNNIIGIQNSEKQWKQIVCLGAGYDSRAFRLNNLSKTTFYEIDYSTVLQKKRTILSKNNISPICLKHIYLPFNLYENSFRKNLLTKGFDLRISTLWILEGLTGYLDNYTNKRLFNDIISLSYKGSVVLTTFIGSSRKAFGNHNPPSTKHIFFTDNGIDFFPSNNWMAFQHRIHKYASIFNREELLEKYDYWITSAIKSKNKSSTKLQNL